MSYTFRKWFFTVCACGFSFIFIWGILGLNPFGEYNGIYGNMIDKVALAERHATNLVASVAYDYRGMDTLCEEFILFASVAGVSLLLREKNKEVKNIPEEELPGRKAPKDSEAVQMSGLIFAAFMLMFGIYMVLHAHLTPGGGFQGGVIIASAILLIYISTGYKEFRDVIYIKSLEILETVGIGGFILIGVVGLLEGKEFLFNFLPIGKTGEYLSGGFMLIMNIFIGTSVAAGIILIAEEFLEQTILLREQRVIYRKRRRNA
jgi:multicomponent Na+:H+ antiporter subunit B